jgi:hypothetical protein
MKVQLNCPACQSPASNDIKTYSEFDIAGYDAAVEWSDSESELPTIKEQRYWQRSERKPKAGEKRMIAVQSPFCESELTNFWVFYQPTLSSINGIDSHIEEIDGYAFVKCEILKVFSIDSYNAWLQILVKEVVSIVDAMTVIPTRYEEEPFLKKLYNFNPYQYKPFGRWEYYFGSDQGDLGNWFLIYKTNEDIRLISFGEWTFHQDTAYLGNLVISSATYNALARDRELYG